MLKIFPSNSYSLLSDTFAVWCIIYQQNKAKLNERLKSWEASKADFSLKL